LQYEQEWISIISNLVINILGSIACAFGIVKIQELKTKVSFPNKQNIMQLILQNKKAHTFFVQQNYILGR
jgi:hypothetical protein